MLCLGNFPIRLIKEFPLTLWEGVYLELSFVYIQAAMLSYKLTQQKLNCCLVNWLLHGYNSYTSMNLVVVIIFSGVADEVLFKH